MKKVIIFAMVFSISSFSSPKIYAEEILNGFVGPLEVPVARNILIGGSLLTATMMLIGHNFDKHNQAVISQNNFSPSLCKYGNNYLQYVPNVLYTVINGTLGFTMDDGTLYQKRAIDMMSASLYASAVTDVIKPIANERRPSGGSDSFPSGHAASAFAFASYVAMEHPLYYGIPAYVMASFVGYSRIASNFHYPHDVVEGATLGISYGIAQYYHNYLNKIAGHEVPAFPVLFPVDQGKGLGMLLSKNF